MGTIIGVRIPRYGQLLTYVKITRFEKSYRVSELRHLDDKQYAVGAKDIIPLLRSFQSDYENLRIIIDVSEVGSMYAEFLSDIEPIPVFAEVRNLRPSSFERTGGIIALPAIDVLGGILLLDQLNKIDLQYIELDRTYFRGVINRSIVESRNSLPGSLFLMDKDREDLIHTMILTIGVDMIESGFFKTIPT